MHIAFVMLLVSIVAGAIQLLRPSLCDTGGSAIVRVEAQAWPGLADGDTSQEV